MYCYQYKKEKETKKKKKKAFYGFLLVSFFLDGFFETTCNKFFMDGLFKPSIKFHTVFSKSFVNVIPKEFYGQFLPNRL
jgi:hypothetical protein